MSFAKKKANFKFSYQYNSFKEIRDIVYNLNYWKKVRKLEIICKKYEYFKNCILDQL